MAEPVSPPNLVWPPPPATPRVAFVRAITGPRDLGIKPSFWQRLREAVGGERPPAMIRPSAVAVSGDLLGVADPGAAGVHIFDRGKSSYRFVSRCGGRPLVQPVGVCFLAGKLYVSDSALRAVAVMDPSGECLASWEPLERWRPTGLATDTGRNRVLVADTGAHKIRVFGADGLLVEEFGRRGSAQGEFNFPGWLAVARDGSLYVVDSLNFRVQVLDAAGRPIEVFGEAGDSAGFFARPKGIALDGGGRIYIVDALFDAVQIFDRDGRLLLGFGGRGTAPGQFWLPSGIFIDEHDFIYVADSYNKRVQVFRVLQGP